MVSISNRCDKLDVCTLHKIRLFQQAAMIPAVGDEGTGGEGGFGGGGGDGSAGGGSVVPRGGGDGREDSTRAAALASTGN